MPPGQPPNTPQTVPVEQALEMAMGHHGAGRLSEAEDIYRQILAADPNQPQAMHLLGVVAHQLGRSDIAEGMIVKSVSLDPKNPESHSNLGLVRIALGKIEEAISSFQEAVELQPDYAEAQCNLGLALHNIGRLEDAIPCYQKALALRPDLAEAHNNLGNIFTDMRRYEEALDCYGKALTLQPNFAGAHCNLGNVQKSLGQIDEAEASIQRALSLEPELPEGHHNLGLVKQIQERAEEAVACFRKAIDANPNFAEAHYDLGMALKALSKIDEADQQIAKAVELEPGNAGWQMSRKLLLPTIPSSLEEIQTYRDKFAREVKAAIGEGLKIEDPLNDIGGSTFYLAYHNLNNRPIMEDVGKMYKALCPSLVYEAPHCRRVTAGDRGKLRIGFLSSFFRNHTIAKLSRGYIEHFSRDKFEVVVLRPQGKNDDVTKLVENAADKVVSLSGDLVTDRQSIAAEELDILFYLDIGMDPYSYFLAFSRLAPVQATTWGHPETTGLPNVDYFISSEFLEEGDSANQYSEQLVKLKNMPTYFYRPEIPENKFKRDDFDLPQEGQLYVCPQALFKFHPDFDAILADILTQDVTGCVVLIDDNKGGHWSRILIERIAQSYPAIVDRILLVPPMPTEKFFGLVLLADALLDIPTFSGGNSSLEAFAMAQPIVTWPQDFMRARVTAGFYQQMGVTDLIADSAENYVELALRLAQDGEFNTQMKQAIEANSPKIFENEEIVRELETFFTEAYKLRQTKEITL
jgi:protein O-GlcNAc transferase